MTLDYPHSCPIKKGYVHKNEKECVEKIELIEEAHGYLDYLHFGGMVTDEEMETIAKIVGIVTRIRQLMVENNHPCSAVIEMEKILKEYDLL